jgi:hypothetical protein
MILFSLDHCVFEVIPYFIFNPLGSSISSFSSCSLLTETKKQVLRYPLLPTDLMHL